MDDARVGGRGWFLRLWYQRPREPSACAKTDERVCGSDRQYRFLGCLRVVGFERSYDCERRDLLSHQPLWSAKVDQGATAAMSISDVAAWLAEDPFRRAVELTARQQNNSIMWRAAATNEHGQVFVVSRASNAGQAVVRAVEGVSSGA